MDYAAHYDRLIARARSRVLSGYSERHHVIPKCLGGSDAAQNIVRLTAEEHFVAHQLLVKINPGHRGLIWSLSAMTHGGRTHQRTNKRYGWLRRQFAQMVSVNSKGKPKSAAHKAALSAAKTGKKRGPHSEEHRARISAAQLGVSKAHMPCFTDPTYKARQSENMRRVWANRKAMEA